ncbi:MAG: aliphatic sulfonate ABC transporter [Desulfobulbus propionicus]|nr:MAG: aliphatic sulfonate ABC transporter [Desulfobulbus propionicus]
MKRLLVIGTTLILYAATAAQGTPLKEINISYVKSPFNLQVMVMKNQRLLEKEFAGDGITINWHEITSGAKQAQAMAAGSLDIGSVMNTTSVLLANAAGNPIRIINGVSRPSKTFAIVARKNGPTTVEELKGASIAGPKGTVLHQLLVAALDSKGMTIDDVNFISMKLPQARTAMLAGKIDAALLAASLVIKSVDAGAHVITTADGLVTPKLVSAASGAFAAEHPDVIKRYRKVFMATMQFIDTHWDEALAIGINEHGISKKDGQTLADWAGFTDHLLPADLDSMREDVKFLKANNMLKNDVNPEEICLPGAVK